MNAFGEIWLKVTQLEAAQSQLSEICGNSEEIATKIIVQNMIHQMEITRVKTDCQKSIKKNAKDLQLKYEEQIRTLEGRIATHNRHYEDWEAQIAALETEKKKDKRKLRHTHRNTLRRKKSRSLSVKKGMRNYYNWATQSATSAKYQNFK